MQIGELVGRGRTSDVFAFGTDSVIKVPHADVPVAWPAFEAELTEAVRLGGVSAPQVRGMRDIDGKPSIIFERISGPSMWNLISADPSTTGSFAADLAAIQRDIFSTGLPSAVPDLVDRMCRKISVAPGLGRPERTEASAIAHGLPRGATLLHGDLHPGNILMSPSGPVVIDWFDATIGHPVADLVRTSILIRPSKHAPPQHLPGAISGTLANLHDAYLAEFDEELGLASEDLAAWHAVVAGARLAEGAEVTESTLLGLWEARPKPESGLHDGA